MNLARILLVAGLALAVVAIVAALREAPSPQPSPETAAAVPVPEEVSREEMRDALVERIAGESAGLAAAPVQSPPPNSAPIAWEARDDIPVAPPTPPAGYSFIPAPQQMAVSRPPRRADFELPPPASYPAWLDNSASVAMLMEQAAGAGRDNTFAWVRLADGAESDSLGAALNALGGEILGAAGPLVRVRLPADASRLEQIASLPEVAGLGAAPRAVKLPGALAREVRSLPADQQYPVFITLMADDASGRWRRELMELGAVVGRFDADIRAYTATVDWPALDAIANADFVLAVEPIGLVEAAHDTAVPAMGVDALRWHSGSPGLFRGIGGASVPIAVMDTGLNINHPDIATNRRSICGANFVWVDARRSDYDLWVDDDGHGTHVTGTLAGNGYIRPEYAGMAPAVSHIRFAKVLSHRGSGWSDGILQGMDWLSLPTGCGESGSRANRAKPLIVNMSLGSAANIFEGRGNGERKLDSVVWAHRQLYVVAQANSGSYAFSNYGSAKNSLSVGAAMDSGELAGFSSLGPTADGRLAPQIVATGVGVNSARGAGGRGGYVSFSGTSMASPTVAGVAALLMDASPEHREQPALARARLMASAIRPSIWLESAERFPATNSNGPGDLQNRFGLGKVSARTSVLNRDEADGWLSGGAISRVEDGEVAEHDIAMPAGASQLALVMTWDEPPTDTIAEAVLNDLDLYLDIDGNCGPGACGEYRSLSRKDNVEWIIIDDPPAGVHRAKIAAKRVFTEAPRAALAWTIIRGDATPNLRVEADTGSTASIAESGEITVSVTADSYVAAGARLEVNCRTANGPCDSWQLELENLAVSREDRLSTEVEWESSDPPLIELGEIAAGETQELQLGVSWSGSEAARLYFTATAWNARAASTSVRMQKSGTADTSPASRERPANADFKSATGLAESPQKLDLLLAGTEPGEPEFETARRPSNSVWYDWTAPVEGFYRFDARPDTDDSNNRGLQLDLFKGESLIDLEQVAAGDATAVEFFSPARENYKIRISHSGTDVVPPVVLRWSREPPPNDQFVDGIEIKGGEDEIRGNNQGATLEPGESFGGLAATVWYRWTAPDDGDWRFEADNNDLRILVFTGERIPDLRLISGSPSRSTAFPAKKDQEYRIALAADDAYGGGGSYKLSWRKSERHFIENDDFEHAEELDGLQSSSIQVEVDQYATVEPGEPASTGVRTKWFEWAAPESGNYTWRLFDPDNDSRASLNLVASVFSGGSLAELEKIGANKPFSTLSEFVFQATEGERYFFSVGYRSNAFSAFDSSSSKSMLSWGPTPENDNITGAKSLAGASGAVRGSNEFATIAPNEYTGNQGVASLWWNYQAPASGWVRFHIDPAGEDADSELSLAVYHSRGGQLEQISRGSFGLEVVFEAQAGVAYLIRLGTLGDALGGEFMLRWAESSPPVWLKFLRELEDGARDTNGRSLDLELSWHTDLTFNDDGTVLYWVLSSGIGVFEHDPANGELKFAKILEYVNVNPPVLLWDSQRSRLLASYCSLEWWENEAINGDPLNLRDRNRLPVAAGKNQKCGGEEAFLDKLGNFLFFQHWQGLDVLSLNREEIKRIQLIELDGIQQAILSHSNSHVYILADDFLRVYKRNLESGNLSLIHSIEAESSEVMAISQDDRYLFVIGRDGTANASIFQLYPDSKPKLLDQFELYAGGSRGSCEFAASRNGRSAVDVFCNGYAFGLEWRADTQELIQTDLTGFDQFDRFDNLVPDFGSVEDGLASPDGKHIYLATENDSLAIFERVGNTDTQVSTAPVLTPETGGLRLPLAEFRDASASLCFRAELRGTSASGNWMDSATWTLSAGATKDCGPASGEMPFVEATTRILRIPHGKILTEDGMRCFTAELQASEDYQHWTLLAGNYRSCQ